MKYQAKKKTGRGGVSCITRRKRLFNGLVIFFSLFAAVLLTVGTTSAQAMEMDFNIPAQTLSSALKTFAEETGLQMLYSSDAIKGIRSSRVNGRYQPKDALNILLGGTGLSFKFTDSNTVVVQKNKVGKSEIPGEKEKVKKPIVLKQMTVTATKTPTKVQEVPTSVQVVTPEDIDIMPQMDNFYNAVQNVPGVSTQKAPFANKMKIRGQPAAILINGRNMQMSFGGVFNQIMLDMGIVERIEVLKGPQSGLHGTNAIGGLINIITKKGDKESPYFELYAMGGEGNELAGSIRASGGYDKFSGFLAMSGSEQSEFESPKGKVDYTFYRRQNVYLNLNYELANKHDFGLEYTYNDGESCYGGKGGWWENYPGSPKIWENGPQLFHNAYLTYNGKFSDYLEILAWYGGGKTNMGWIWGSADDLTDYLAGTNVHKHETEYQQAELRVTSNLLPEGRLRIIAGFNYSDDELRIDVGDAWGKYKMKGTDEIKGYYGQVEYKPIPYALLVGALRYDEYKRCDSGALPKVGLSLFPFAETDHDWTTLWATYGKAFRAPTIEKLYHPNYGTPDLKPEKSDGWEIGIKQQISHWANLEFSYYDSDYKDKWMYIWATATSPAHYDNVAKSYSKGWELLGEVYPTDYLRLFVSYSDNEIKDEDTGKFLTESPEHIVNYGFAIEDLYGFYFAVQANYCSGFFYDKDNALEQDSQTLVNTKLMYKLKVNNFEFSPFFEMENLTDEEYYGTYGGALIGEGSAWHIGATLRVNF